MADVTVKGLSELQTFLDQLPAKLEANIMRGALRAGMKPIQAAAKAKVPRKTGTLADGLKIYTKVSNGKVIARLRATGKDGFLAYWFEYTGARAHEIKPKNRRSMFIAGIFSELVQHPGFKPKPFLRPALDEQAQAAVIAAGEYIKNRLATKEGLDTSGIMIEGDE